MLNLSLKDLNLSSEELKKLQNFLQKKELLRVMKACLSNSFKD